MAQSYLSDERTKDMKLIGEEYFENLAMRSFFQDFERDEFDGSVISCKMHDIVHDFARFITKNECISIEIKDVQESRVQFSWEKGRHLIVGVKNRDSFPMYIFNAKKLRSLKVNCERVSNMTLSKLFCDFTCLRTLDLNYCDIKILPREIKSLIHLRYLDISQNKRLEELPETLCELYNLQTLDLNYCEGLKRLPQEMGKLINLRHLKNDFTCYNSLIEMPRGIEGLTSLQTLTEFSVRGNRQGSKASNLEYLKMLNNLQGSLDIIGLGDLENVGEVNNANLVNKRNLLSLRLYFRRPDEVGENWNWMDEAIFKAMHPPPNLETLEICNYEGQTLSWDWRVSFYKLRFLRLWNCINLEDWDITKTEDENMTIMPSLKLLLIQFCPKLKSLPDYILQMPTLKQLKIIDCPILKGRYNKETGVDWRRISHIPNVKFNH